MNMMLYPQVLVVWRIAVCIHLLYFTYLRRDPCVNGTVKLITEYFICILYMFIHINLFIINSVFKLVNRPYMVIVVPERHMYSYDYNV